MTLRLYMFINPDHGRTRRGLPIYKVSMKYQHTKMRKYVEILGDQGRIWSGVPYVFELLEGVPGVLGGSSRYIVVCTALTSSF